MYLINTAITVDWVLGETGVSMPVVSVLITDPVGVTTTQPINSIIDPTVSTKGLAKYIITPSILGIWTVTLIKGIISNYSVLGSVELFIFNKEIVVNPVSYNPSSLAL